MTRKSPRPKVVLTAHESPSPPRTTRAEGFYYVKQIEAESPMVFALLGGERRRGRLRWYDRDSLGIVDAAGREQVIAKREIKYLYKDESATSRLPERRR